MSSKSKLLKFVDKFKAEFDIEFKSSTCGAGFRFLKPRILPESADLFILFQLDSKNSEDVVIVVSYKEIGFRCSCVNDVKRAAAITKGLLHELFLPSYRKSSVFYFKEAFKKLENLLKEGLESPVSSEVLRLGYLIVSELSTLSAELGKPVTIELSALSAESEKPGNDGLPPSNNAFLHIDVTPYNSSKGFEIFVEDCCCEVFLYGFCSSMPKCQTKWSFIEITYGIQDLKPLLPELLKWITDGVSYQKASS